MRRKEDTELSAEAPEYLKAQRIACGLIGIANLISDEERMRFEIPKHIEIRSMRNAIARHSLLENIKYDETQLQIATNITKWLTATIEK